MAAAARRRLGATWEFAHLDHVPRGDDDMPVNNGVLYDGARYQLASIALYSESRVEGEKPVLEVRLRPRRGGTNLQIFVVHLMCCTRGRDLRARQFAALTRVLAAVRRPNEQTVLLGDFNTTEPADRQDLRALAASTGLTWASEPLACTAFWQRDTDCLASPLDHVLTWAPPSAIAARGGCDLGCARRDRCPAYRDEVSDHCPVVATFD